MFLEPRSKFHTDEAFRSDEALWSNQHEQDGTIVYKSIKGRCRLRQWWKYVHYLLIFNEIKDILLRLLKHSVDIFCQNDSDSQDCNLMLLTSIFDLVAHVLLIISYFVKICYFVHFCFVKFCYLVHMSYIWWIINENDQLEKSLD